MIFVAVGTQGSFDRMIRTVDSWAAAAQRSDVFAQIGTGAAYRPAHIRYVESLSPDAFRQACLDADLIVAHAGMGTIITALEMGKPVVVLPRIEALGETRNDHQMATAAQFAARRQIHVAMNEEELRLCLEGIDGLQARAAVGAEAATELRTALRRFVVGEPPHADGRRYDAVVCFGGEDWWYHNRGHYDMQMMYQIARQAPVLYINSIGMRPLIGGNARSSAMTRAARKWRSIRRGLSSPRPNFWTISPVTSPGLRRLPFGRQSLAFQVRWAMRRMGILAPLVWVACPAAEDILDDIPHVGLVYQRTDCFEEFPGVNQQHIRACDAKLKARADLTLFCSRLLYDGEKAQCTAAAYVDHGVDFDRFADAGDRREEPSDIAHLPHPRIGFIGGIDSHTFDPTLFCETAKGIPDCSFILVGACSLPHGWCNLPNVHLLGQKPYESVAAYMAACDVLIMPWNRNEWIRACNPVKLKEYLSVGRPVVSTPFAEIEQYRSCVTVAEDSARFIDGIRRASQIAPPVEQLRARVRQETWESRIARVYQELQARGLQQEGHDHADDRPRCVNVLQSASA